MEFNFNVGDTNFIALVNSNTYKTFVDEDKYYGTNDIDIEFKFTKVSKLQQNKGKVYWWNI